MRRVWVILTCAGLFVAALLLDGSRVAAQDPDLARGKQLYERHCSVCHGEAGRGDGPAAYLLLPKPRDFTTGAFRLVSTTNGIATDEDLLRVITNGMTGSAMPPWARFPEADRKSLVAVVKELWREGLRKGYLASDDEATKAEVAAYGRDETTPGKTVSFAGEGEATSARIARGRIVYFKACAPCHGPDGRGKATQKLVDGRGFPAPARDYTKGIFKGGSSARELYARLRSGMKGTGMPRYSQTALPTEEAWSVVHYIRTLFPPQAQERQRLKTQRLVIRRVKSLPKDEQEWWKASTAEYVSLAPLWWRDQRIEGVLFQAVHDSKTLAVRLIWEDRTKDLRNLRHQDFHDGAALQFSWDRDPPFFGMGDANSPVLIWSWKASWQEDQKGFFDLEGFYPHMHVDTYYPGPKAKAGERPKKADISSPNHDKRYMTGWGAGNPVSNPKRSSAVEVIAAKGLGSATTEVKAEQRVTGKAVWDRSTWSLVMRAELPEERCKKLFIAFAVWNGSQQDRNGQKSVSIWHHLSLE